MTDPNKVLLLTLGIFMILEIIIENMPAPCLSIHSHSLLTIQKIIWGCNRKVILSSSEAGSRKLLVSGICDGYPESFISSSRKLASSATASQPPRATHWRHSRHEKQIHGCTAIVMDVDGHLRIDLSQLQSHSFCRSP